MKPVVAGVGMTPFGNHADKTLKELGLLAINQALEDAGINFSSVESVWAGTAGAPIIAGQVCINGQVVLQDMNENQIPIINVENACATASTAFQQAATMVELGLYDIVLAFGVEKLYYPDRQRIGEVFMGCTDRTEPGVLNRYLGKEADEKQRYSVFMDIYATIAEEYMKQSGATKEHFAQIVAKNSYHGSLNEYAQFQEVVSVDEALNARSISGPLTLPMCSPIGDGAAAAVIVSPKMVDKLGLQTPVFVRSSILASGSNMKDLPDLTSRTVLKAYEEADVGPEDLGLVELHDATAPAEMMYYESLGLCRPGEGPALVEDGATSLGGRIPVSVSGGLIRKGHPIGATGLAQIFELTKQLRNEAGERQVENARVGLAENGGGWLGGDAAAIAVTVLSL